MAVTGRRLEPLALDAAAAHQLAEGAADNLDAERSREVRWRRARAPAHQLAIGVVRRVPRLVDGRLGAAVDRGDLISAIGALAAVAAAPASATSSGPN